MMADQQEAYAAIERSLTNVTPPLDVIEAIEGVRAVAKRLARELIECVPDSRERSLALTKLEESVMWAVKGLALHGKGSGSHR